MILRSAVPADAEALLSLERAANLATLTHVFPAELPYPAADVLARWRATLVEPGVTVEVGELPGPGVGLAVVVAHDETTVRHLAVHPDAWGRGWARLVTERAAARIRAGGQQPRLWCLGANTRARGFYEHLGWRVSGLESVSEYPPHPVQVEYILSGPAGV